MKRWDIPPRGVAEIIAAAARAGLVVAMDDTLRKFPGSRHWHFRVPGHAGTVEVTRWESGVGVKVWVNVQAGRATKPALDAAEALVRLLLGDDGGDGGG
jgi:hypothetical protein